MRGFLYIEWASGSGNLGPGPVRNFRVKNGWLHWSGSDPVKVKTMSANLDHVRMYRFEPE